MQIAERDGKLDIRSMLPEELAEWLAAHGEQKFRAKQIFRWLTEGVRDFAAMTDISAALREISDRVPRWLSLSTSRVQ